MRKVGGSARVARYLMRQIRTHGPGQSLPSFRSISQDCKVSATTLSSVIRQFEKRGLLVVRSKQGVYTPPTIPAERTRVELLDVLYVGADPQVVSHIAFRQDMLWHLGQQPSQLGYSVRFHGIHADPSGIAEIEQVAEDPECEACLVINLSSLAHLQPLQDAHVPYVAIYPESPEVPAHNCVTVDHTHIVASQLQHLLDRGHRHIGYLYKVRDHTFRRSEYFQREAFYRMALKHRLPIDDSDVQYAGLESADQIEGIHALLDKPNPPTAIICNDAHLPELYKAAEHFNLRIGHDLSVIGANDGPEVTAVSPPATTLRIPRGQAVKIGLEMLETILHSSDATTPNRNVAVSLIERASTGRAPTSVPRTQAQPQVSSI
ncbi:substrate-binding domain-containing protein [Phycisphaerales bacterium AB-hyl4]|uniref:Substrate-binding domain-containing protein n=1 Tax=Natronomicrosphaera hydrolytica TaxID=3242702 RepID=A0ABV4U6U1_9BACT